MADYEYDAVLALVTRGHKLLEELLEMESTYPPDERSWEKVVEFQEIMERLRSLRPARVFRKRA